MQDLNLGLQIDSLICYSEATTYIFQRIQVATGRQGQKNVWENWNVFSSFLFKGRVFFVCIDRSLDLKGDIYWLLKILGLPLFYVQPFLLFEAFNTKTYCKFLESLLCIFLIGIMFFGGGMWTYYYFINVM